VKAKKEETFESLLVEQEEAVGEKAYNLTPVPHIPSSSIHSFECHRLPNFAGLSGGVKLLMTIHMSWLITVLGQ
jgi:hypothetical protein